MQDDHAVSIGLVEELFEAELLAAMREAKRGQILRLGHELPDVFRRVGNSADGTISRTCWNAHFMYGAVRQLAKVTRSDFHGGKADISVERHREWSPGKLGEGRANRDVPGSGEVTSKLTRLAIRAPPIVFAMNDEAVLTWSTTSDLHTAGAFCDLLLTAASA